MSDKISKPYINLNNDMGGGILSLFMYDKGVAKHLSAMAQELMRRPSTLTVGERELIAAYASKINNCQFCYRSHKSCAEETGDRTVVRDVLENGNLTVVSMKMESLLKIAAEITGLNRGALPMAIQEAKEVGATDQEIHDTVAIAAFINMCNRYTDGLGTIFRSGEPEEGGKALAKYGYKMGIHRFTMEVLPKLWSNFWSA